MLKILFILIPFILNAIEFKVASYNVENLFDLQYKGTEYKEFIPNKKTWNKKLYYTKLKHISKVINALDADILALQEIESKKAFDDLNKHINYKYKKFIKKTTASIGLGIVSKFPIIKTTIIKVDPNDLYGRDILKATIQIDNKNLIIYANHWRSKRAGENTRVPYATALMKDISLLPIDTDYIILGDLNSNYNEFSTFKFEKRLNNTYGITAINQVLNTTLNHKFINKNTILQYDKIVHYNLWLELPKQDRFSFIFRKEHNTPDNILLPKSLFDNYNISYKNKSFKVFKPQYLYHNNSINKTFSDHLPIYAIFTTIPYKIYKEKTQNRIITQHNNIKYLYNIDVLNKPIVLEDIIVIYKSKKNTILKQGDSAIVAYNCGKSMQLGGIYDIVVNKIENYFGTKEITSISTIVKTNQLKTNISKYYIDGRKINLFNPKYQNNIIKNLRGTYHRGYLYFKHSKYQGKIKLYLKKSIKKIKDKQKILIKSAHLSYYKSKVQLVIYKNSDLLRLK